MRNPAKLHSQIRSQWHDRSHPHHQPIHVILNSSRESNDTIRITPYFRTDRLQLAKNFASGSPNVPTISSICLSESAPGNSGIR